VNSILTIYLADGTDIHDVMKLCSFAVGRLLISYDGRS